MASQVEVCNRAMIKIGGAQITSITENSKAARVLGALWDTVRKAELSKRYWNFALARTSLAALSTAPAWGFGSQYQLPVDFLKLSQINDQFIPPSMSDYQNSDGSAWAIESSSAGSQVVLTDFQAPLKIRYVKDVTDPGLFDPQFVEVLASKLAYESCYAIHQSREGQKVAMDDYERAVKSAALSNAIAKAPQEIPDDSWMMGRL